MIMNNFYCLVCKIMLCSLVNVKLTDFNDVFLFCKQKDEYLTALKKATTRWQKCQPTETGCNKSQSAEKHIWRHRLQKSMILHDFNDNSPLNCIENNCWLFSETSLTFQEYSQIFAAAQWIFSSIKKTSQH